MGKKGKRKASKKQQPENDELLTKPKTLELGKRLTMAEVVSDYLLPEMADAACRKATVRDNVRHTRRWAEWCQERFGDRPLPVSLIRRKHLQVFRDWLRSKGHTAKSCNSHLGTIRKTLLCAQRHELIENPPALETIHTNTVAPKVFPSFEEVDRLWDAADGLTWPTRTQAGRQLPYSPATGWRALLVMLRTYGFRTQELVRFGFDFRCLTWGEIHPAGQTPNPEGRGECEWGWFRFVPPKQEKKKPQPLTNPLTMHARAALEWIRPAVCEPTDSVFDWPLSSASFYQTWHRWFEIAGIRPRDGAGLESYLPKHERKAATTHLNDHAHGLGPYVVGHDADRSGTGSVVSKKHYYNAEAFVLAELLTAPMPRSFDRFLSCPIREGR